jgi:hypothetical protein
MSSFVIRKNAPIPARAGFKASTDPKYPVAQLEVDESFFIPEAPKSTQVYVSKLAKAANFNVVTRTTTEDGVKGLFVGRIAGEYVARVRNVKPKADAAPAAGGDEAPM